MADRARPAIGRDQAADESGERPRATPRAARVFEFPVAGNVERAAYIAGTFDTKGRELFFLKQCIERLGLRTVTVDLSTSGSTSTANVHPREVARHHPDGERAVFTGDRGAAVSAMAVAFEHFVLGRRDLGGIVSAGGSGGTALATPAMRALPVGVPKMMVSSVASGDVRPYVGPSDICMMYSVTDVSGINRISEKVLANAAHALAGMIAHARTEQSQSRPALGLTMFGVTTPCVQAVTEQLQDDYDCLVFHATGTGGQSMEKLRRLAACWPVCWTSRRPRSATRSSVACCRPARNASMRSSAPRFPTSARAARSTWSTSGPRTRCPPSSRTAT